MIFEHQFFTQVEQNQPYHVVEQSLMDLVQGFGVTAASSIQIKGAPGDTPLITNVRCKPDTEFTNTYKDKGLARHDVALRHALGFDSGFYWRDIQHMVSNKQENEVFDIAAEFGYRAGFVVPYYGKGGRAGLTTFMGQELNTSIEAKHALMSIGTAFYRYSVRKSNLQEEDISTLLLTDRQKDIVYWVAEGKTDEEIAIIVGISRNTVSRHLEKVRDKLNVRNKIEMLKKVSRYDLLNQREFVD